MVNTERLLATFLDLVQIDNPSGGEGPIAAHIRGLLEGMGLEVAEDALHNLLARVPGEGQPLLLNAHMDSVAPCHGVRPLVADGVVRSSGDTVLGADDLAGVAAIVEGLRATLEQGQPHRAAEIVFTVQEEVGLRGAAQFDTGALAAREGVTLDSGGDFGGITVGAPSQDSLYVLVQGRASHAGVAPERGVNAIVVAAEALAGMPLGRIDDETTANFGIIKGGAATNIVPDRVELWGEARSHDQEKLVAQVQAMVAAFEEAARARGASVKIEIEHKYDAYRLALDLPIVQRVMAKLRAMGHEPNPQISGGGSDVNIFAQRNLQVVNVSVGYREIHSTGESIAVADLERAAELVRRLLAA
ncbi:MAG TPA: M20/M25/M40 family metallo-hydrolase [Kouleothrix sp.]|uniref:M20/M25/M40 family metallo-hydrolase n=1 Tax=Kouleothrix sp. TaxID=2779161 RepID=UPI002D1A2F61|nr:M20/M25/M40 family metallo-hydrolase [Kouleothrix sp.]HRC75956.1 M20/M25/M40 family metallo-hydrolase [Kouleothrix sp.]